MKNQMNIEKIEESEYIEISDKFIQLLREPPATKEKKLWMFDSITSFSMSKLVNIGRFKMLVSFLIFCVMIDI